MNCYNITVTIHIHSYIALTDCGPDWLSYTNLLDYLLVILTGLTVERI